MKEHFYWWWPLYAIIFSCIAVAYFIVCSVQKSIEEKKKEFDAMGCVVKSKEYTGKKIYCGKACFRDEIRTEFQCNNGIIVEIH